MTESTKVSGHYQSTSMHEFRRQTGQNVRIQPEIQPRRPENRRVQSPSIAVELFRIAESGGFY